MEPAVITKQDGQLFEIILNQPAKRNAIGWDVFQALAAAIECVEHADGVRAVLLSSSSGGFSVGLDLNALANIADRYGDNWQAQMPSLIADFQTVLNKLERLNVPTVALLRGYALGLGFEIALACDFRFAARHTKLALPETRLGLVPDVGGTTRLTRLIGPARAKEYIMSGKLIPLHKAEVWGLVNRVVPAQELRAQALAFIADVNNGAPLAVNYTKQIINELSETKSGQQLEIWAQSQLFQTQDFQIGLQSALQQSTPRWLGK
jgi:enoyl-CoA hydratase/carnithine racemase